MNRNLKDTCTADLKFSLAFFLRVKMHLVLDRVKVCECL